MGFFGNLLGQAVGGGLGGLLGNRDLGAKIGGFGGGLLPFSRGGRLMGAPRYKKGGKVCSGCKSMKMRKGSAAMKKKMAMVRAMKN